MKTAQLSGMARQALLALLVAASSGPALADFSAGYNAAARHEWDVAFAEFLPLAEQGDMRAMMYLATMYRRGLGAPRNPAEAARWYSRAAELGNPTAQYNLAVHYRQGMGVDRDDARANELFEAAARQGLVQAQINLGLRLLEGTGSPADPVRGFAWLEKAASSGSAEAIRRRDYHARGLDEQQRTDAEALARTL